MATILLRWGCWNGFSYGLFCFLLVLICIRSIVNGKQACHCEAFFAEAISLVLWTNLGDCFAPLRYARKDIIIFYWADTLIFYNLNFSIKKASLNFFWKAKIFSFLFLHKAVDGLILKNNLAFIKKMIIIHTVNDNHSWCELNNHNWR